MSNAQLCCLLLLLLHPLLLLSQSLSSTSEGKLPIVFVYLLVNTNCSEVHIPLFIWSSLNQTINYQTPDCDVYFITDIGFCPHAQTSAAQFGGRLHLVDINTIISPKTKQFGIDLNNVLSSGEENLYTTSALRFFALEDLMIHFNLSSVFQVETDNLIFGSMTKILPFLQHNYPTLAATPVGRNRHSINAGVFWIHNLPAISHFNAFLMNYTTPNSTQFAEFHAWAASHLQYRCRMLNEERCFYLNGNGVKRYFFNEMSFLAHYQRIHPSRLLNLPLLPHIAITEKHGWGIVQFGMNGEFAGGDTFGGVWDSGGWGQNLGGIPRNRNGISKDLYLPFKSSKGTFIDVAAIIGGAMVFGGCIVRYKCAGLNFTMPGSSPPICLTAPHISCGSSIEANISVPLFNLHVHSKLTNEFQSQICSCD